MSDLAVTDEIDYSWMRLKGPQLARDIVVELGTASSLARDYGLTPTQWERVRNDPYFRELVAKTKKDFEGKNQLVELAKVKAQYIMATYGVDELGNMISNATTPAGIRNDVIKTTMEIAGIGRRSAVEGGGELPPLITIVLDGKERAYGGRVIEGESNEVKP